MSYELCVCWSFEKGLYIELLKICPTFPIYAYGESQSYLPQFAGLSRQLCSVASADSGIVPLDFASSIKAL